MSKKKQKPEALRDEIQKAVRGVPALFGVSDGQQLDLWLTYDDHVIVRDWRADKTYRANWSRNEDEMIVISNVVEVEQEFVPVTESLKPSRGTLFTETIQTTFEVLEAADGKPMKIRGTGITAGVVNGNGRRYPRKVLQQAIEELQPKLNESAGQGRLVLTGEVEHPTDKSGRPNLLETVARWDNVDMDSDGRVILEGEILPTSKGRDLQILAEAGVPLGISQRAYGAARLVKEGGSRVQEITELHIMAYDFVSEPSDPNGRVEEILESKRGKKMDEQLRELLESQEFTKALSATVRQQIDEALSAKTEADRERPARSGAAFGRCRAERGARAARGQDRRVARSVGSGRRRRCSRRSRAAARGAGPERGRRPGRRSAPHHRRAPRA
jgi:hypothetical protein